jgi:hypothetical protein
MRVLALWLWLERAGFRNFIQQITSLPFVLINEVADETVKCLNCINNNIMPSSVGNEGNIPIMQSLVEREISLRYFFENRNVVREGVAKVFRDVCMRAVIDLMQEAMVVRINNAMIGRNVNMAPQNQFLSGSIGSAGPVRQINNVPADDRTLFLTFSKGYRVEEWELRDFFTMTYGDCIEALYMQEVQPNEQPLFARIVFHHFPVIGMILGEETKVNFKINGKHVRARKFVALRFARNFPGESSNSSGTSGINN